MNQYIGGIDHLTGHLLYSRFFVKAMNDMDMVGFREPFARLFHQGWVQMGGTKMSKTRGNVTGPEELVEEYGADAVRLYILFMGPADQDMEWTPSGIDGITRFLRRLWRIVGEVAESSPASGEPDALTRKAHETIARATDDVGRRFQFNTPIAAVMELANELAKDTAAPDARFAAETALSLIQPYAPHVAEELWERLGNERLWEEPWPEADPRFLERETFELVVQVNGKVRDRFEVDAELPEQELVERALGVGASTRAPERQAGPEDDRRPGQARESRRRLADSRVDNEVDFRVDARADADGSGLRNRSERPLVRLHCVEPGGESDRVAAAVVGRRAARRAVPLKGERDVLCRRAARRADSADRRDRSAHHRSVDRAGEERDGGDECDQSH